MGSYTYGSGTPTQFQSGEQRQVLELGSKIHMYNPDVTPLFTIMGRASTMITPVPIFEWMEDEWFVRPDIVVDVDASGTEIKDSITVDKNDTGSIITLNRQAQQEGFERGAIYTITVTGSVTITGSLTTALCIAQGDACDITADNDRNVQFVFGDGATTAFTYAEIASTTATFGGNTGTIVFKYVGIGMTATDNAAGARVTQTSLTNNDVIIISNAGQGYEEGAGLGAESRKKVRRLKNCTQIWREPYTITGTQNAAKMYGGPELARLQARKLARIKADLEYSLLTNGAFGLDSTSENPKRTMGGFGLGGSAGFVQSLNADVNANMSMTETYASSAVGGMGEFDGICGDIFKDQISGSMRKTAFCSNRWLKKLADLVRTDSSTQLIAEMGQGVTAGLRVTTYYAPVGEIEFISHPILNNTLDAYALVVDFANVDWRPLNGRDIQLRTNVVQDGRDGQTDEWLIEAGCEIRNEQTHAIMKLV